MDYVNASNIQKIRIINGLTESFDSCPKRKFSCIIFYSEFPVTLLVAVNVMNQLPY